MLKVLVVNCSQIFCTFAVETTWFSAGLLIIRLWIALKFFVLLQSKQQAIFCVLFGSKLWIALKFFVLLQSKQLLATFNLLFCSCELLSNFLYFCSRNNREVVLFRYLMLWIALKFFVLLQSKQLYLYKKRDRLVVNCSQIFCTFAVETTVTTWRWRWGWLWIALKFFVLLQSKQLIETFELVAVSCELLSNFLYFCSRNNKHGHPRHCRSVVNCSQIFCTFAVETTHWFGQHLKRLLWIALKFFVLLQSKQPL